MRDKWGAAYWDETWHRYIVDHLWANDDPEFTAAYTVAINRWDAEHIHGDGTNYYDHEVTS